MTARRLVNRSRGDQLHDMFRSDERTSEDRKRSRGDQLHDMHRRSEQRRMSCCRGDEQSPERNCRKTTV